jgi:hypothetical protein
MKQYCILQYNSLFLSSSHNFNYPHFYIKYLNMPTLITQDEFEEGLLLNSNLTMAIPAFVTLPVAQIPKKKFKQLTMRNGVAPPSPKSKSVQVQGHNRGSTQVHSHLLKINAKPHGPHGNKRESKATKFKKKTGTPKHPVFHNGQDDCKESVQLAKTLQIQELWDLMNSSK